MAITLRSANPEILVVSSAEPVPVTSVVYTGQAVTNAVVIGSASMVVSTGGTAVGVRMGFRNMRTSTIPVINLSEIRTSITGDLFEDSQTHVMDLEPGDVLQLNLHATASSRLSLRAQGWTVVIL